MEASLGQDGDGWKPHLAQFMQPLFLLLFLIGEGAPDRSLSWGVFSGGKEACEACWIGSLVRVGPKQKVPLLLSFGRFVSLSMGLLEAWRPVCWRCAPGHLGQVQNEATGECR
jgi:hypothetical protein